MRITERRLRQLIRNVIKESLDQLGSEKIISIQYSEMQEDAFNKKVIDYCMRDLSQLMDYVDPPSRRDLLDCNPHASFGNCKFPDPYDRDELGRGERNQAFENEHEFVVTSHPHPSDEGGKSWEFRCEVEGELCGFRVTVSGLPAYWQCETIDH